MVIGFTGTRHGMTPQQKRVVADLLNELIPHEVRHGDCKGADYDFHRLVRAYSSEVKIVIHPGHNDRGESPTRAYCEGDETRNAYPYLVRDDHIVKAADVLIATPKGMNEEQRSGTWATVRRARKANVPQYIVGPNGALI